MAYYVGKNAAIAINGVPYCLTDWNLDITTEEVDLTTFCSLGQAGTAVGLVQGVNTVVGGIIGGSVSASGPYTGGAPTSGQVYPIIFYLGSPTGPAGGPSFTQTFLITSVRLSQNVRDKAMIEITGTLTALPTL
jgi:hypothetical protein